MIIEPIASDKEFLKLKAVYKDLKNTCFNNNNLIFIAKKDKQAIGVIELVPIRQKAILINLLVSNSAHVAKNLLIEALMHAWELNYCAAFAENNNPVFNSAGFELFSNHKKLVPINDKSILAYALSHNGINHFVNECIYQLN